VKTALQLDDTELVGRLIEHLGPSKVLENGFALMRQAHKGAVRDEGTPYIRHPLRVALILVEELGISDINLICTALLHDTLEDCKSISEENIRERFGPRVATLVRALTDELKGSSDLDQAERKIAYLKRIATEDADCILVKMCDRLDNLRSLQLVPDSPKAARMREQTCAYLLPLFETRLPGYLKLKEALLNAMRGSRFDPKDREVYKCLLHEYLRVQPDYEKLADYLRGRMDEIAKKLGIYPIIMARAKSLESFAEKVQRAGKHYSSNPLEELTDLCGVRVITYFLEDVRTFAAEIEKEFIIDRENSADKKTGLALDQFGYISLHLIFRLKRPPDIPGLSDESMQRIMNARSELQLRTIGQHMWAGVFHEMGYKNEFQLPARWQREFARAAAMLEGVDQAFQETKSAMGTYESSYGAYMNNQQLERLANRLEVLLEVEPHNVRAVHRLVRVYLALEGSDKRLRNALEKYGPILREYAPALRDTGVACTRVNPLGSEGFLEGQELLRQAIAHDPNDIDAHCSLGGTYRKLEEYDKALECYRDGYQRDPTNPYALGNYIVEWLVQGGDHGLIDVFYGVIQGALDRCNKLLEVQVNFPWTLYDMAMFLLYRGRGELYDSYKYFAKGIDASTRDWMVGTAAKTIGRLVNRHVDLKGIDLACKMLAIGHQIKSGERPAKSEFMSSEEARFFRSPLVILAGGCAGLSDKELETVQILRRALADFRGVLVSGGTNSGIAAIPGDLQSRADRDQLVTIGYVPGKLEDIEGQVHQGYSMIVRTSRADFSILEPLTFWENYWKAGFEPDAVKLIGFNGGNIAAVEYRLALAFGAKVGIVHGSGREADRLLEDTLWKGHPRLSEVDPSEDAIRRFLTSN
jgi:ppGpp synthetase/RelA/SpoT-type nucleotidyltranferase